MAASLTLSALTGTNVNFLASEDVFLPGDVGRQIISGASRAIITVLNNAHSVNGDILDAFPSGMPIPAGQWFLRLSPQVTLDPDKKGPIGSKITLVAGAAAFRPADVGKYILLYGGVIQIVSFTNDTTLIGELLSDMSVTAADPAAAPAGSWTLEEASWSVANGFPRTGEFYQGRLAMASTTKQPTTFWLSRSDDFDNFAVGVKADDAIEYTVASRKINRIEWIADQIKMFLGTAGTEFQVQGQNQGDPLGGDVVPVVSKTDSEGSGPLQPVIVSQRIIFVDRSLKKIFALSFDLESDGYVALEVTGVADHILDTGVRIVPVAVANRPDPRLYFVRADGQLVALTFFLREKVIGFSRIVTDGEIESVAVIPQSNARDDKVWVIVKRQIGIQTKRFVEYFESSAPEFTVRWKALYTDSAVVKVDDLNAFTVVDGLEHLESKEVDVVADGSFIGTKVVESGQITLDDEAHQVEVGLHYDSTLTTFRPTVQNSVVEGLVRSWDSLWLRLRNTIGGTLNDQEIVYDPSPLNAMDRLFTGDRKVTPQGSSTDGAVTVKQTQPYPMTILALFGQLDLAEVD